MAGEEEPCVEMGPEVFKESTGVTAEDWRNALSKVVPAVVVIHTTSCRAFDTHSAGSSYATGFVVDKKCGIILTNRHVVKPGPVVAEAMFLNREEIPVYPMYRDPVHDFGFFRYDPGLIQFLSYEEIPLAPEAACVGLEIRVVGNDSGEKMWQYSFMTSSVLSPRIVSFASRKEVDKISPLMTGTVLEWESQFVEFPLRLSLMT